MQQTHGNSKQQHINWKFVSYCSHALLLLCTEAQSETVYWPLALYSGLSCRCMRTWLHTSLDLKSHGMLPLSPYLFLFLKDAGNKGSHHILDENRRKKNKHGAALWKTLLKVWAKRRSYSCSQVAFWLSGVNLCTALSAVAECSGWDCSSVCTSPVAVCAHTDLLFRECWTPCLQTYMVTEQRSGRDAAWLQREQRWKIMRCIILAL